MNNKNLKVAVFMGGISSEREISLRTGSSILKSLIRLGYDAYGVELNESNMISAFVENNYDLAYLALHGEFGEDGRVQAILDILKKPYTGSGFTPSAIAMDKVFTKVIASSVGIKIAKNYDSVEEIDNYPVIVKPATEGSSVGIFLCKNKEDAQSAVTQLTGKKVVIEEYVKGEEITVGVVNGEGLGVTRISYEHELYDYEAKYAKGGSTHEYPAKIDKKLYDLAVEWGILIHKTLGLSGISRSDFMLKGDEIYFLEVNTCPGMTETSLIPELGTLKGYTFDDLVEMMVSTFRKDK